ncbi:MAG: GntR family transcriptional regulator [Hyphomicrobiales bacterium]
MRAIGKSEMDIVLPQEEAGEQQDRPKRVYGRLRQAILSLDLLPGEQVSERALERLLGTSRTPVREALVKLQAEGLVVRQGRGYRVTPIDLSELLDVFEFRESVEATAVRLACERAEQAELSEIQALLDAGLHDDSPDVWFDIGTDVHVSLARLSRNRFLVGAVQDVVTRIARARWMMASSPQGRADAHHEHSTIVRLIGERRPDEAADAVVRHSRIVRDQIVKALRDSRRGARAQGIDVV